MTDAQFENMKYVVGEIWLEFGRRLLNYSHSRVRDIISPYNNEQLRDSEKAYYVLEHWKQRDGRRATVEKLLEVCEEFGKRGAAELALAS